MNQRQFASVLFAVVGVFIAATRLPELFIHAGLLAQSTPTTEDAARASQPTMAAIGLSASIVAILVGGGLVLLRHRLAERLFAGSGQPLDAREVQAVAFSVLGCYFAVEGISRIGWAAFASSGSFRVHWVDWAAVIQLGLGVVLFFGGRGLSALWSFSRSAGQSRRGSRAPSNEEL